MRHLLNKDWHGEIAFGITCFMLRGEFSKVLWEYCTCFPVFHVIESWAFDMDHCWQGGKTVEWTNFGGLLNLRTPNSQMLTTNLMVCTSRKCRATIGNLNPWDAKLGIDWDG